MSIRLLILDTSSLFFRAFHALPSLTSASGEQAGAVYGFLSLLFKAVAQVKPTHIAAALDAPGPTLRDEILPTYKANRPEIDPELRSQLAYIPEALDAFGIPSFIAPTFEADDVIGTIVAKIRAEQPQAQVIILSGDLDTLQLVDEKVSVIVPRKGISETMRYTPREVQGRFGLDPKALPQFKALRGDPSDNIPGVLGIGEKGAALILQRAGSLEGARKLLCDGSPPKELTRYAAAFCATPQDELARLISLVTIRHNAPVAFSIQECAAQSFERPQAQQFLSRLGFASLRQRLGASRKKTASEQGAHQPLEAFIQEQEKAVLKEIRGAEEAGLFSKEIADLERELIPVISAMERRGILLDAAALAETGERLRKEAADLEAFIFKAVGASFNLASPAQLREILFSKLGLASLAKTDKGQASTAASVLSRLRGAHPAVEALLRWRELNKLLTTYVDALPKLQDAADGAVHAKFWQLGTATGRIASSDPNLQNIPARTKEGRAIRSAFRSRDGMRLLSCDYSQMELRIAAVVSEEERLRKIFLKGGDVHVATAARIFHVAEQAVTSDMRSRAKTVNFAMLYGAGPRRIAEELSCSPEEAQALLDEYFAAFPQLASWIERAKEQARRDGFVATPFGRKRYLPDIASQDTRLRAQAERMAVNTIVQGGEADLVKRAMVRCAPLVPQAHLLVQVHDELLFEVDEKHMARAIQGLKDILETIWPEAPMPFPVSISSGTHWGAWT